MSEITVEFVRKHFIDKYEEEIPTGKGKKKPSFMGILNKFRGQPEEEDIKSQIPEL